MRLFLSSIFASILLGTILCSCVWENSAESPDFLPLDDSAYPFADLPRLVIETDDFAQINNKETKVPAKLQVYGKNAPESDVVNLTIKGRGNSSFVMAKFGYKLKFENKETLFDMPKNREWDLIPNHRDKSMLRNYVTYQLAGILQDEYFPKCKFVEVYINREYLGVFLLAEHIKVGKNRVDIADSDSSFLFEKTSVTSTDGVMFTSSMNYIFKFCSPKNPSLKSAALLENHINDFETFLKSPKIYRLDSIRNWIDVDDFIRYYWIQEFSKNLDGAFRRSVYLTWETGDVIKMGPVWDFDIAYGLSSDGKVSPENWYVKKYGWYRYLHKNAAYNDALKKYWIDNHQLFEDVIDSAESQAKRLSKAMKNEYKRWPVLQNDTDWPFIEAYDSYEESVDSLKAWIHKRIRWIDANL